MGAAGSNAKDHKSLQEFIVEKIESDPVVHALTPLKTKNWDERYLREQGNDSVHIAASRNHLALQRNPKPNLFDSAADISQYCWHIFD